MAIRKFSLRPLCILLAALCLTAVYPVSLAAGALRLPEQQTAPAPAPPAVSPGQQQQGRSDQSNVKPEPPPISKAEEGAFLTFVALQSPDNLKIISQGQEFLSKYALSRYRPQVYAKLEIAYLNANQLDKLVSTGQLALNEDPDNIGVLALMAATLPRIDPHGLDAAQRLDLAERYARRAIHLSSALTKPEGVTEEQFTRARNEGLAMAHTGLGLVYYRRGDTASSVSELDQATKLDPTPEPIDFYLLGEGEMKLKQYAEAAAAFDRCARAQWASQWQERCRQGAAAAQKASAAQHLSAAKP